MPIDPSTPLAQLALERPARTRVLERLGLDYCCGGKRSLAEACERRGLQTEVVVVALEAADESAQGADEPDWTARSSSELCDHIVSTHHAFLRSELPRISGLLEKVERAHGRELPRIPETRTVFEGLRAELESHLADEEQRLFPAVRAADGGAAPLDPALLTELSDEHAEAGAALERLHELTGGYDTAAARCNTHRATLEALHELELDLHRHIHEENNVLFPRLTAV